MFNLQLQGFCNVCDDPSKSSIVTKCDINHTIKKKNASNKSRNKGQFSNGRA